MHQTCDCLGDVITGIVVGILLGVFGTAVLAVPFVLLHKRTPLDADSDADPAYGVTFHDMNFDEWQSGTRLHDILDDPFSVAGFLLAFGNNAHVAFNAAGFADKFRERAAVCPDGLASVIALLRVASIMKAIRRYEKREGNYKPWVDVVDSHWWKGRGEFEFMCHGGY